MINLTIDGKPVQVPDGTTVLQAAQAAGIHIPTLCNHPALKPFGGCRLCLVEVEGMRTLQPSCTMPASDKMVVLTGTDKVKAARRFVLNMIFSDRNHFCPYCQVTGGDCELQNSALDEGMSHWNFPPNWERYPVDATHDYFVMDHNRCILCHRCVRACGELVGNFTLGIEERGARSMLVADTGVPLGSSSCVSCGTCVAVCPTGALIERNSAYQGPEKNMTVTRSICMTCSMGCGIQVYTRDNRIVRIVGDWDAPVNGGVLCKNGRFVPLEEKRQRVTTPLVRKNGRLEPASWEEALQTAAARLRPLAGQKEKGIAALASPRLPAEALAAFKQLFGGCLGAEIVTSTDQGRTTGAVRTVSDELGRPIESGLAALRGADCVLTLGAKLYDNHMVAGFFIKRNLPQGTRLVLVESENGEFAARANVFLKTGAVGAVIDGLKAALVRLGLQSGDAAQAEAALTAAAQAAGVTVDDLLAAAGLVGSAERPAFVYRENVDAPTLRKLVELAGATHAALVSIKGLPNMLAAAQMGLDRPFALNGHQAAYLALGDEAPSPELAAALRKAPFLVVQASYTSELTEQADVVLPVEMWAEQEGHFLNLEGRIQQAARSLQAPAGVRSNLAVLQALAEQMNATLTADWQAELAARPLPVALG